MAYSSPKTLRHRQQRAESKRLHRPQALRIPTEQEWDHKLANVGFTVNANIWQRHAAAAGRCATALGHMAIQRRGCQIMRERELPILEAIAIARIELLGKEPA